MRANPPLTNCNDMTKEERINHARQLHADGCNCCQSVVLAYADQLPISEEHAKAAASTFGRGVSGLGEVCGCVSGMAMVCGLTGKDKSVMKNLGESFKASNGDLACARLLAMGKKPCRGMVAEAAGLLADVLQ